MKVLSSVRALREWRSSLPSPVSATGSSKPLPGLGFVPTMGFLHAGHLSLVQRARQDYQTTLCSIFVNPLQFGPNEDLSRYPRDLPRDLALLEGAGCAAVFVPPVADMYPHPPQVTVK